MKSYKIKVKRDKKSNTVNIDLSGVLSISEMSAVRDELKVYLKDFKNINLTINEVDEVDLSLMQLLYSFKTKCSSLGIDLSVSVSLGEDDRVLLERAGLVSNIFN